MKHWTFLLLFCGGALTAHAQSTAFTYQGRLAANGAPYTGFAEMQFALFNRATGGVVVATTPAVAGVNVSSGLFTVSLDFGAAAFPGEDRWLEIQLRTNLGPFITLSPRQPVSPTPYALFARTAGTVTNNSVTAASIASGQVVKSLNGLRDVVNLAAGTNVTITPNGNNLALSAGPWLPNGSSTFYNGGNVGIGTTTPNAPLHIASDAFSVMTLQDTGPNSTQSGYVSYRNGSLTETAWVGFGTPGDPDFSIVNARSGGDIVLLPFSGNVGIGTATPAAKLDVRGDIRLGTSGQFRAAASEENLRIVRGRIDRTGAILSGTGFQVIHENATGFSNYTVTFNTPFASTPTVTGTAEFTFSDGTVFVMTDGVFSDHVYFRVFEPGASGLADSIFQFIAIGPR